MSHLSLFAIAVAVVTDVCIKIAVWRYLIVPKIRAIVVEAVNDVLSAERHVSFVQPLTEPQMKNLTRAVRDFWEGRAI